MSVLKDLYDGKIQDFSVNNTEVYKIKDEEFNRIEKDFISSLTVEQMRIYNNKLTPSRNAIESMEEYRIFSHGFKTALLLILECLCED